MYSPSSVCICFWPETVKMPEHGKKPWDLCRWWFVILLSHSAERTLWWRVLHCRTFHLAAFLLHWQPAIISACSGKSIQPASRTMKTTSGFWTHCRAQNGGLSPVLSVWHRQLEEKATKRRTSRPNELNVYHDTLKLMLMTWEVE